jgi:hypothetical protein
MNPTREAYLVLYQLHCPMELMNLPQVIAIPLKYACLAIIRSFEKKVMRAWVQNFPLKEPNHVDNFVMLHFRLRWKCFTFLVDMIKFKVNV